MTQAKRKLPQDRWSPVVWPLLAAVAGVVLLLIIYNSGADSKVGPEEAEGTAQVELVHIHGLGYSADGQQLSIPAHFGLRVYEAGRWYQPEGPEHDYMGYAAVNDGFFSSGHPDLSTDLPNPLGLVRSRDLGLTVTPLAFLGQFDFHVLGAGYYSHAVYVFNYMKGPDLPLGLHYTLDNGQSWQAAAGAGLPEDPVQIAVHPTDPAVLAVGTAAGVYISNDYGETFAPFAVDSPAAAVAFTPDGLSLVYGWKSLSKMALTSDEPEALTIPSLPENDSLSYIAVNPVNPDEMAIASANRNVFLTVDAGVTWQQIAAKGKGQ